MHDRLLGFGGDHWIEDDRGGRAFLVDGRAMRLRDTWELKDTSGRVLVGIRQAMFALRDTMEVRRAGERLATVRRGRPSPPRDHYRVALADGDGLDVGGSVLDREFAIEYDGEPLAVVSRRRPAVRDAYGLDVVHEDADPALLIALAVCVVHLAGREHERKRERERLSG